MKDKIKIACPHEKGEIGISKVVNDHYPLNKEEIANLLKTAAQNWNDPTIVSEIQIRLNQGIVGITCPRPIKGKVAEKLIEMDRLFMKKYKEGSSPETVNRPYQIMVNK